MTKKKSKKRAKGRKQPDVRGRGSDRLFIGEIDKIFAKLLILMGILQAISLNLAFVRVFEYFFEVRYFEQFAGVGVMLIITGLILLLRDWVTRNVMKLLSVFLAVAIIIQMYVISKFNFHLYIISRIEFERGESSITLTWVTITAIIFTLNAIVSIFAVLDLIFNCKQDGKEEKSRQAKKSLRK